MNVPTPSYVGDLAPVLTAIRAWYGNLPDDEGLMAAWEAYCEQTGQCFTCERPRCPECKLCAICAGDGHDEGCSRQGDEYTPEQRAAIERESIEDALENDRCGICGSVEHFREDHR